MPLLHLKEAFLHLQPAHLVGFGVKFLRGIIKTT